jgi:DNA-binding NtrC family response regulator
VVALAVIWNAETRLIIKTAMDSAGHRLIQSGGYRQAQLLMSSGLSPDLLFVECTPERLADVAELRQLLKSASADRICLVVGMAERTVREEAAELGIKHLLTRPVTRRDIESLLDGLNSDGLNSVKRGPGDHVHPCFEAAVASLTIPLRMPSVLHLEELGQGQFFLAASPKMLEIQRQAKLLANVDATVLIQGESGTGKEVIAHLIHKYSRRSGHGLQKVNCAALPEGLLESELFGFRQGAFTGAIKDRAGKFEQADHGTLLLDEIGEISSQTQAKFLQVLQDGQFTRLGDEQPIKVDVRVIASTNIDMETALQAKIFRADLYYRLSVITIQIPPLRERRMEIPYLIEEIIRRAPDELRNGGRSFTSRLMDQALLYDWRGNVRELRNFVTRNLVMQDQDAAIRELETRMAEACTADHQEHSGSTLDRSDMRSMVRDVTERTEVRMIQDALDACRWNRRHAAKSLKISYRGLLYKIQQHRLTPRRGAAYSARKDAV